MSATVSQEKCPICEEELELKDTVKITHKVAKVSNTGPKEGSKCDVPLLTDADQFFDYFRKKKMNCEKLEQVGGNLQLKHGDKAVCLDERFGVTFGNCVVLSFETNNEWSFDDAMANYGCTVYAFDPTMGKENFNRTSKIHFYNLGLSNRKGIVQLQKDKDSKVDTYGNIVAMLGLTNIDITYLKIDIEGAEIDFFLDVFENSPHLLTKVKQLAMEIHPNKTEAAIEDFRRKTNRFHPIWDGMHRLECLGFRLLSYEQNPGTKYLWRNRTVAGCYEVLWAKDDMQ